MSVTPSIATVTSSASVVAMTPVSTPTPTTATSVEVVNVVKSKSVDVLPSFSSLLTNTSNTSIPSSDKVRLNLVRHSHGELLVLIS